MTRRLAPPHVSRAPAPSISASPTPVAPPAPLLPTWTCQVGAAASANTIASADLAIELRGLTVGQPFRLVCGADASGDTSSDASSVTPWQFNSQATRIEIRGADAKSAHHFQLRLLEVLKNAPGRLEMVVAGYETGDQAPRDVVITDGTHSVQPVGFQWTVQSILKQVAEEQAQETGGGEAAPHVHPYGLIGPQSLSWSWNLIAPLIVVFLLLLLLAIRFFRQRLQDGRWKVEVERFKTARRPLDEMLGEIRALDRKLDFNQDQLPQLAKDLRYLYDIFLVRTFLIPAHLWRSSRIMGAIAKTPITESTRALIRRTLVELRALEQRTPAVAASDVQQVIQLIRKSSDLIVSERDRGQKRMR